MDITKTYIKIDENTIEVTLVKKWNIVKQNYINEKTELQAKINKVNKKLARFENA